MPIIKAAVKHLRKSERLRKKNRLEMTKIKDSIKELIRLAKANKMDEFRKKLPGVVSIIDKAAKKNIFHKNNAARKKSRLAKLDKAK